MFDSRLRPLVDPLTDAMAGALHQRGISANCVTIAGFCLGVLAAGAIVSGAMLPALLLILASRLADGVDGALARRAGATDFGGFLDIALDFAFYGLVPLAFALADPPANALAGAFLLFAFYVNGASFLALAALAEKRGLKTDGRGSKAFFFASGLAEATETYLVFVAACLFPAAFPPLALVFAVICLITAGARIAQSRALLG